MARSTIPLTVLSTAGATQGAGTGEITGDTVNQHDFDNGGDVFLCVRNNDAGAAHNITWKCPRLIDGVAIADVVVSVPSSATRLFGPFPPRLYNQDNSRVHFDVDSTELRMKAYLMPEVL